jgi:putative two-component system response regulator
MGYPNGLTGEQIPLMARIFAIADAFDAMTSDRIYRKAFSIEKARTLIFENKETQFCPKCVDAFMNIDRTELEKIAPRDSLCEPLEHLNS